MKKTRQAIETQKTLRAQIVDSLKEAIATGADVLVVSCPYEVSRFEDSIKLLGCDDKLVVRDLVELLDESAGGEESL